MHRPILSVRRAPRLRRALPLAAGLALALPLGAGALAAPAASAATTSCLVADASSDQSYTSLQDAVTAATTGDTLFVKGTCTGTTDITKSLTITGQSNGTQKTATLNGGSNPVLGSNDLPIYNPTAPNVLTIEPGVTVTLNTLVITNGYSQYAGGIYSSGTLTLNGSTVTGNYGGADGGGIWIHSGTLTLNNSTVTGNHADGGGGGIWNCGTVTLAGSTTITGNTALPPGGGGIFNPVGTLVNAIAPPAPGANVYNNTSDLGPDNITDFPAGNAFEC